MGLGGISGTGPEPQVAAESISLDVPADGSVAARYALALLGLADDKREADPGALDRIASDMEGLLGLCRDDAGFRALVQDPRLSAVEQQRTIFAIVEKAGVGAEVRRFLGVLIRNRRLAILPQVALSFAAKLAARRGEQFAQVTTAFPLTDTLRTQITARLTESGYSGVKLVETVDRAVLGGLIVRIGSRLYDNSLKSKLQRLQFVMKGAA